MVKKRKKRVAGQARRTRARGSGTKPEASNWAMFLAGLGIGLVVALFVYINTNPDLRFGSGFRNVIEKRAASAVQTQPAGEVGGSNAPKAEKPKFDFYTVLPGIEKLITDDLPGGNAGRKAPVRRDDRFVLQAASYASFNEADRLKAKLALSGLEAHIEKITIENRGDYYRVRLGPYDNLRRLDETNRQLAALGIRALRLRVSQTPRG